MHREIARRLSVPRPTVTRWFRSFSIPTLPCHRITNQNLLNTGPRRTPPAKPKPARPPRRTCNEAFFDTWTPESAYLLGYFAADGCMFRNPRGSYYLDFTSTDRELIVLVKRLLHAPQRINVMQPKGRARKIRYHLQIGSKRLFERLRTLGFTERKSLTLRFPDVPMRALPHFVRGYFDGDGGVAFGTYARRRGARVERAHYLLAHFTCGNRAFLRTLNVKLHQHAHLHGGTLATKQRGGYTLAYSRHDAWRLYRFMYLQREAPVPHLHRKRLRFEQANRVLGLSSAAQ